MQPSGMPLCMSHCDHTRDGSLDQWMDGGAKVADLQGDLFGEKKSVSLYKFEEIVRITE